MPDYKIKIKESDVKHSVMSFAMQKKLPAQLSAMKVSEIINFLSEFTRHLNEDDKYNQYFGLQDKEE
jgi:hypothetical protein